MKIDICMTAVRRPDLLKTTLDSFQENLFSNFVVECAYVNLDPAFGDASDEASCEEVLRSMFPRVQIRKPETPSFGAAVKWLWGQAADNVMFHMEDDWICLEHMDPQDIEPFLRKGYDAVAPLTIEHHWKRRYPYLTDKEAWFSLFGKTIYRRVSALGTSPKFILPAFANAVAELLIPSLDPEKQQARDINPALAELVQSRKCAVLTRGKRTPMIRDIGRAWAAEVGISKVVTGGETVWNKENPTL
ncbi:MULTISPECIES: glycosyltransferase family 2 protein [Paracoccaceae]|jgi:hypothetical protein|uniref:glycosyltransferase family 2 protein n=1 Tax=Rhodobacterales TaxID=204455 RepID=UPI001D0A590A|nr:hypothetical protein [Boseongicola sp. H5]